MKPLIGPFDAPIWPIPIGDWEIPIHGFGVLVALGFVVGGQVSMNRAKALGLQPDVINRLIGWLVVGTFVGGHVGYGLMYEPARFLSNPREFLYFWHGLSSFGGFVVCVPLGVWFLKKEKVPIWPYLDCLGHGLAVGWFFGRMGCFVAHGHPGTATEFYLGVYGICKGLEHNASIACHDMGLYESLWSLATFGVFKLLDRVPRVPGFYVILLGLAYGPTRFAMDFLRPETTDVRYLGLTPAQYWSVFLTIFCAVVLYRRIKSGDKYVWPEPNKEKEAESTK
ncbi:MAG: hypothetical protein HN348_28620 [Proteobacteria bacterium]|nr:hypothetical protein [Pseudomonadota bacterium]